MSVILSQAERDELMLRLTTEQQEFLTDHVKRGKRTMFARVLAHLKGISVHDDISVQDLERLVEDWRLIDFKDAGPKFRETALLKCECGRVLRYQYTVENRQTGQILRFGETHFEEHTGLPPRVVSEIKKGFEGIDYELDELLTKKRDGWELSFVIPKGFNLPDEFAQVFNIEMPLLARQEERLWRRVREYQQSQWMRTLGPTSVDQEPLKPEIWPSGHVHRVLPTQPGLPLFPDVEGRDQVSTLTANSPLELSNGQREFVLQCLREGTESVRVICELMIKRGLAREERYSTAKPAVYPLVCLFLEGLRAQDEVQLVKTVGRDDRWYQYFTI